MKSEPFSESQLAKIDEILDRWEALQSEAAGLSTDEFLANFPELQDYPDLRQAIVRHIRADRWFSDLQDTDDGPTPPERQPPSKLGRYELLERIGQGGFGQVWRSRDTELERDVAIKIPRPDRLGSPEQAKKFREEARKVAKLDYPGIVPVFYCDQQDSYFFIVSKWIDGSSLAERLKRGRLSPTESARIVAEVADALHHAHLRDLVHRDVKPGNILLDAQGRAYLTDFGIAVTEDDLLKDSGSISGTLGYMAPEQAQGEALRVTSRTDIYSLGVVLYELLTGRQPFRAKGLSDLREQVLCGEPRAPRTIDDTIPAGLERICLKAMAKDPERRYTTAADMARDLRDTLQEAMPRETGSQDRVGPNRTKIVRRSLAAMVAVPLVVVAAWWAWPEPPLPALRGSVQVHVLKVDGTQADLTSPSALPLQTGDAVRLEAHLNRPAYVYLLWINAEGEVSPIYPWQPGRWDERPVHERPVDRVSLPDDSGDFWSLKGEPGVETVLLLARERPLPADTDLVALLSGLPRPTVESHGHAIWFGDGTVRRTVHPPDRGPDFDVLVRRNDRVAEMHGWLRERLKPFFLVQEGVSFVKASVADAPSEDVLSDSRMRRAWGYIASQAARFTKRNQTADESPS